MLFVELMAAQRPTGMSFQNHIIRKQGDLLKTEKNEGNVEEMNYDSSGSDMDGEMNPSYWCPTFVENERQSFTGRYRFFR